MDSYRYFDVYGKSNVDVDTRIFKMHKQCDRRDRNDLWKIEIIEIEIEQ